MRRYSHTSMKLAQRCLQAWYYKYKLRIEPKDRPPHLQRGSNLHEGLEKLYRKDGLYEWILEASDEDADILDRYARRWEDEDYSWEVLHIEEEFELEFDSGIKLVFIPDLVVRINGDVWVVDHKTTANIPDEWDPYNMTDFQHLIYLAGVRERYPETKGFIFNYIRTKAPTQPKLVKDGSRIANLRAMDTTYEILLQFAEDHGMETHEDVHDKLSILRHTPDRYFQRHYIMVPTIAVQQALHDVEEVLKDLDVRDQLDGPFPRDVRPKHAGTMSCSKCDYQAICHADLLGINRDEVLLDYIERPRRSDEGTT